MAVSEAAVASVAAVHRGEFREKMADTMPQAEKVAAQIAEDLCDNLGALVLFGTEIRGGYAPAE